MTPTSPMTERMEWRGRVLELTYVPDWLGRGEAGSAFASAHLEIHSVEPVRAPLPITETGYRSHFLAPGIVEDAGGPTAFVRAWLDAEAKGRIWATNEARFNQLDLFSE